MPDETNNPFLSFSFAIVSINTLDRESYVKNSWWFFTLRNVAFTLWWIGYPSYRGQGRCTAELSWRGTVPVVWILQRLWLARRKQALLSSRQQAGVLGRRSRATFPAVPLLEAGPGAVLPPPPLGSFQLNCSKNWAGIFIVCLQADPAFVPL